jgi:hypothetical protein
MKRISFGRALTLLSALVVLASMAVATGCSAHAGVGEPGYVVVSEY